MAQLTLSKFTTIIIDGTQLTTKEENVKEFEIQVSLTSNETDIFDTVKIPVVKENDFYFRGTLKVRIKELTVGTTYYFRIRVVRNDGFESMWSEWEAETAGDTSNSITIVANTPEETSTAVTFSASADNIPEDFEEFQWKVVYEDTGYLSNDSDEPAYVQPAYPGINDVPDFITTSLDDISLSLHKNRTTRFTAFIRGVDQSGNVGDADVANNGWVFLGHGKMKTIDLSEDMDNKPPDLSEVVTPSFTGADDLNFI